LLVLAESFAIASIKILSRGVASRIFLLRKFIVDYSFSNKL
jgi:hypothetical protein